MWRNIKYLLWCLVIVVIFSGIISALANWEILFSEDIWSNIATFGGFSLSLCGIFLTILLYNYITYEDVKKNIHEEQYLSKKGLEELKSDLENFVKILGNNQEFNKTDLSKEINRIRYFYNIAVTNPNSILSSSKKDLGRLVSEINRRGLGKKSNDEINKNLKHILRDNALTCLRSIEIIYESYNQYVRK